MLNGHAFAVCLIPWIYNILMAILIFYYLTLAQRTVMEAVSAILGGELHVGVVLQGKKVGDDSKTLAQTGICHGNNQADALGFTLEPNSSQDVHFATRRVRPSVFGGNTSHPHSR